MAEEVVVRLSGTDRSGASVARDGDERLLVHGGIPGEVVRVRRSRRVGHGTLAEIVELRDASPFRVVPRCRHADVCGGCSWQHVAYEEQLRTKARVLQSVLRHALPSSTPAVLPTIGTPVSADGMPWEFRQKAAFVFAPDPRGGLAMGHFARGTHDVVPVVECPVHPERANRIAFALRDELRRASVPAAGERLAGLLRHVLVRTTRDSTEAVALLVATRADPSLDEPLRALATSALHPEGVALNLHDRPGPYLLGRETVRVSGTGHVRERALGPAFLVSPTAFFQTNVAAAAALLGLVLEAVPGQARVLDLYSGSGLFALPLAASGRPVVAVEESRKGVRDAELNRRTNGVPEAVLQIVAASAESALRGFAPGAFDAVVLDPPRDGASPRVLREVFSRLRPTRVALVSCNPDALARELAAARQAGYRVLGVQGVDMFPHTPHIEALAVLERRSAPGTRRAGGGRASAAPRPSGGPRRPRRT